MQHRMIRTIQAFTVLLLGLPTAALSQVPDGIFIFELSGENAIYDIGNFSDCETVGDFGMEVTLCLTVNMVPDGKGKYSGTATLDFSGALSGLLLGPASGSIKGSGTRDGFVKLKFKASGFVGIAGSFFETKVALSCKGPITSTGFMTSRCKVKLVIEGEKMDVVVANYAAQVEGGPWTIILDVTAIDEKQFVGTAVDSLGYSYKVEGKYNAKKDTSKVKATGIKKTASDGTKFQLKNLTGAGTARAKYKLQGYKGTASVRAVPEP